jgi:hypothetical protein
VVSCCAFAGSTTVLSGDREVAERARRRRKVMTTEETAATEEQKHKWNLEGKLILLSMRVEGARTFEPIGDEESLEAFLERHSKSPLTYPLLREEWTRDCPACKGTGEEQREPGDIVAVEEWGGVQEECEECDGCGKWPLPWKTFYSYSGAVWGVLTFALAKEGIDFSHIAAFDVEALLVWLEELFGKL